MRIEKVTPITGFMLKIVSTDGREGVFDVSPYFKYEAFKGLKDNNNFSDIHNGKYFVEWGCGADLSADTIEAHMK